MESTLDTNSNSTGYKPPLSQRINFRIIFFAAVVIFLLGWPLYTFLWETITHGVTRHGNYATVDLKAMGNFPFDGMKGTINDVPAVYRALDNTRVVLEGEIWTGTYAGDQLSAFELVYSKQKCCFGGPPRVQERVYCLVPGGKTLLRPPGYARVTGLLHVKLDHDDLGKITSVYTMDVESVEPK